MADARAGGAPRRRLGLLAVLLLPACEHGAPFSVDRSHEPNPPVLVTGVQRLTFNPAVDGSPRFTPDGAFIVYSYRAMDRADRDRCLAFFALDVNRITRQYCPGGGAVNGQTSGIGVHAVSPGGRLAYVYELGVVGHQPFVRTLEVGALEDPESTTTVMTFPFTDPVGGLRHQLPMMLDWVGDDSLVFLGAHLYGRPDPINDTLPIPLEVVVVRAGGGAPAVVPGTRGVTSLAVNPAGGAVLVTWINDSIVYRLDLATGARTAVFDFGSLGPVRFVTARGNALAVVAGGRRIPIASFIAGIPTEFDYGGVPWRATLPAGAPAALEPNVNWFRGTHFDPAGTRLVGEGAPLTVTPLPFPPEALDTAVQRTTDLWLWRF